MKTLLNGAMPVVDFGCPRTCPLAGEKWCRFRPVLDSIGPVRVNSHTAKVAADYKDRDTLRAAVKDLGWEWLGDGCHHLYDDNHTGTGIKIPGWQFPVVLGEDGTLKYDDFGGRWGNVADLQKLTAEYAVQKAMQSATQLGWLAERTAEGILIHHPSGATLTVSNGEATAHGFNGQGCHEALLALNLPLSELTATAENNAQRAEIQAPQG